MFDLINDVFTPVYERVVEKKTDLIGKQKKRTHGFEPSWFTPQVVSALKAKGLNPISHGKGVDLTFPDGLKLELKAASDFRLNYLIKEGALRYNAPVLFLCNGTDKNKIYKLKERPEVRVLHYDYLNDGKDDWILGLIEPIKDLEKSDNNTTAPRGGELSDLLKIKNVSHATASRLETFMEQLHNSLSSKGIYYRVRMHSRGLTYFPTDKDRPKAFWINLAQEWFTIAFTDKDGEHSKRVFDDNLDKMLVFAESFF